MAPTNRTALCPGTFDPVTFGHLDVINRASGMFDEVVVAVVNLPWRKGATLFSAEERVAFLGNATSSLPNISVETFSTLLVDFARERGATAIVKGLRAISLMASPKYSFISSSGVKELATFGGEIDDLVTEEVARALKERLGR
jgi:pantetheine-phosphate adenylyltransferase